MKYLSSFLIIIFSSCIIFSQETAEQDFIMMRSEANRLSNACIIVRVPTQGKKLTYLKSRFASNNTSAKEKTKLKNEIKLIMLENENHINTLRSGFSTYFDALPYYFIPDTLFKAFYAGQRDVFLDLDSPQLATMHKDIPAVYYLISHDVDITRLYFTDKDMNKLDSPYPYKKNVFFPAFKKIFNTEGLIHSQVKWLNKKLNNILIYADK